MTPSYLNDNTIWCEKQDSEARRRALPKRLPRLTRSGSIVVQLSIPPDFKETLKAIANRAGLSVNRLIRKLMRTRRYFPIPEPTESSTHRLTLRLLPEEWQAIRDYAAAWGAPLWRAVWLLVARPYTVEDRPRKARMPRLTRKGSIVVQLRIPPDFKETLKEIASHAGLSVNRLIRKVMRTRRYFPIPEPAESGTHRLTLRLLPEEWCAIRDYAAAWRAPLWRAVWLLIARPYTVDDRPRKARKDSLSYTPERENPRNRFGFTGFGEGERVTLTSHRQKEEAERRERIICDCNLTVEKSKPVNGLAQKLHDYYGVKLSVANALVALYDKEAIEAAIELRERRNGAIYNPAGFIIYLLRKGCAQRWAEIKRARQDPEVLAQQVKEAVEAAGFPIPVTIEEHIPFAEFPKARLALPLDPERAVATLSRILQPERALPPEFDEPEEPNSSHHLGRAEVSSLHDFPIECVDAAEANPDDTTGDTAIVSDSHPSENDERETEDADRCRLCGKHNSDIPICEDTGLCLECAGYPTQRICYDCGGDFEIAYRERFDALLCRRCYLKRLAQSAGMTDYEPPPRFPWIVFPEKEEEAQSQPSAEAQGERQQARKTPLDWLKSLFRGG